MEIPTPPEDVAQLRAAIERPEAPAALRRRVERQIAESRERRARRRRVAVGVLAVAGALAASAVAFVLPHGSATTVAQVVRVAASASRAPAPPIDRSDHSRLTAHVDDVWFPNWSSLGWRPVGRSSPAIAGRRATTVYYARGDGVHIAYTIVAGGTLPWPSHTRVVTNDWMPFNVYSDGGRHVIGWRTSSHQCLIAAPRSLPETTLLALAARDA